MRPNLMWRFTAGWQRNLGFTEAATPQMTGQFGGLSSPLNGSNKRRSGAKPGITPQKRQEIKQSLESSPKKSHQIHAQELGLTPTTVWQTMRKDIQLFPYISTHHVLKPKNMAKHVEMCEWLNDKLEHTPEWLNNIWLSDKVHIHLNSAVDDNNIFWGHEYPEGICEKHLK